MLGCLLFAVYIVLGNRISALFDVPNPSIRLPRDETEVKAIQRLMFEGPPTSGVDELEDGSVLVNLEEYVGELQSFIKWNLLSVYGFT